VPRAASTSRGPRSSRPSTPVRKFARIRAAANRTYGRVY
jgi:hypothetical protein